jgi:hypothetical protein
MSVHDDDDGDGDGDGGGICELWSSCWSFIVVVVGSIFFAYRILRNFLS